MLDLAAFALSCGYTRVVALQVGRSVDGTYYLDTGVSDHPISHRVRTAGGKLINGQHLNLRALNGNQFFNINRLLNTLAGAVGVTRNADGAWVDNFGDASLPKGHIRHIVNPAHHSKLS